MEIKEDRDDWSQVTERITISGAREDERYASFPFSKILSHYRIAHTGILTTNHPYELTRVYQNGSCMVATLSGEGRVFVDGYWISINEGQACLLPPFAFNSIRSVEGKPWTFTWVKYLEEEDSSPIVTALSPVHGAFDGAAMKHAVMGLHHNLISHDNTTAENLWVELIHQHVMLFSRPKVKDERLWVLWTEVQQDLSSTWRVEELAEKAKMSTEHLRRLCKKQFGRSAKQQLEHLRMRKARILLGDRDMKIEAIAREVGYPDAAAFSNAFKKFMGFRPSEMR
ncbi:MAG: helix-turn-helix transcriptional regulator [Verrucomicrobiota bacterium JB023]|nr:helix-turn-helix transcriptional regulator [Verrucomicrobiota bacterium JB023]